MKKQAVIVHLNDFFSVTPLVGGYLKAYALTEPEIRNHWDIELYSTYVRTPASVILDYLVGRAPDLVAFSVYTWNVGLAMRLLQALRDVLAPTTQFLLGGTEVMHLAHRFVQRSWENVSVCNGEGERTFRDFLLQIDCTQPAFEQVRGLSFYRDGELMTTPAQDRIRNLSEIPSPWLNDLFTLADMREVALFETNRGCPYACEFCYWGGAIGQKVHKLELDRIKEELTYISRRGTKTLAFVDANVGIFPQDVEIARHVADCKRKYRQPSRLIHNSAKNNPERVEEIATLWAEAGLLFNQAISLQSTSDLALKTGKRINLTEDYLALQRRLNAKGIPTFVELIWPMPGETLESLKNGVDDLCRRGSQSFFIHPLQWLNNVGYYDRKEELGVATLRNEDPLSATENVIKTREVSYREYIDGLLFSTSLLLVYTCRGLYTTMQILDARGIARFRDVVDTFKDWMGTRTGDALANLWHEAHSRFEEMCKGIWPGIATDLALHRSRADFECTIDAFAAAQMDNWVKEGDTVDADLLAAAVEFDQLSRPYLYFTRKLSTVARLHRLVILEQNPSTWVVKSPYDFPAIIRKRRNLETLTEQDLASGEYEIVIDHRSGQVFTIPGWGDRHYHWFAAMALRTIVRYEPRYTVRSHALARAAG
jgi:radical SAM superfamily enzyme YgiQ (UPF0313 family)